MESSISTLASPGSKKVKKYLEINSVPSLTSERKHPRELLSPAIQGNKLWTTSSVPLVVVCRYGLFDSRNRKLFTATDLPAFRLQGGAVFEVPRACHDVLVVREERPGTCEAWVINCPSPPHLSDFQFKIGKISICAEETELVEDALFSGSPLSRDWVKTSVRSKVFYRFCS